MKYALITGASSGIGLAYAEQLAARGYSLVIVSNQAKENEEVASQLSSAYHVEVKPLFADLSKNDAAEQVYSWVVRQGIEVEILINNAGVLMFATLERADVVAIERIINLHCLTPTKLCKFFASDMKKKGRGHLLIMSSMTAWTPYPTMSVYGASKSYLRQFTHSLWHELKDSGVSVTTVFPSAVDTPLYSLNDGTRKILRRLHVMLSAEKVAQIALKAMFKRHRVCKPGFFTSLEIALCSLMPTWLMHQLFKMPVIQRILKRV